MSELIEHEPDSDASLDLNPQDPWSDTYCPTDITCDPWPWWVEGFRPHQLDAVELLLDGYGRGKKVMVLDAPVGAGKTLIAEMTRRRLGGRMLYVAHSKGLQDQFVGDFPYAKVLKGRRNYPTLKLSAQDFTAADCTGPKCRFCDGWASCPYQIARTEAKRASVSVVNTAYMLAEGRTTGKGDTVCGDRDFTVIDECDTLEGILLGTLEFRLGNHEDSVYDLEPPVKGAHGKTIADWLEKEWLPRAYSALGELGKEQGLGDMGEVKVARKKKQLVDRITRGKRAAQGIREGGWVRDYEMGKNAAALVLKPVRVDWAGQDRVWAHASKFLCMSGTVIDGQVWAEGLGLEEGEWEIVTVPMTFPAENRPVIVVPLGYMDKKNYERDVGKVLRGVEVVLEQHGWDRGGGTGGSIGENTLIHTVSYALNRAVVERVVDSGLVPRRKIHTYQGAYERDTVLERFKQDGGVLIGPSLDRGVDLPGDLCRVQVICKVPYPNLGDRQVAERMRGPGGQRWYATETARTIVQMTGRGVRGKDDQAVTYILDANFMSWYKRDGKGLLPQWWLDAMSVGLVRQYQ